MTCSACVVWLSACGVNAKFTEARHKHLSMIVDSVDRLCGGTGSHVVVI
jgi:hypothetical protein